LLKAHLIIGDSILMMACQVWPGVSSLDLFAKLEIPRGSKRRVKERLKPYVKDQWACDLIDKLLNLDPGKRCGN
jgi:cyclin-dependent kinase 9